MRGSSVILLGLAAGLSTGEGFDARFQGSIDRASISRRSDAAAMGLHRLAEHQARFDSMLRGLRKDGFSPSAGLHMARQLEHIYADVLREPFPAQNAFELFPIDSTVPPGARFHTVRRLYQSGDAAVYRGGNQNIPRVGLSQQEEQFPVKHYVTSFCYSLFEALSSQFANTAQVSELLRIARDVIMEFSNRKTWYGDEINGIYGVLNYPWLAKKVVVTPFTSASSPDDVIAELNALVNFPVENSNATLRPDTVCTSMRVRNYLMNTPRGSVNDTTIGEFWMRTNSMGIKRIEEAWELQGVGPGGTDGFLAYRRDRLGISNVIPQTFTTLPVQSLGFEDTTFAYMSHGGVIMRDVGNNILGWIDVGA